MNATTADQVFVLADCRLNYDFLHTSSLKSATVLMREDPVNGDRAQLNTGHRRKSCINANKFMPLQHTETTASYRNASYALQEEEKVLEYINKYKWLPELHTLHNDTLRDTLTCNELNENLSNVHRVNPSLRKAYKRHLSAHAALLK